MLLARGGGGDGVPSGRSGKEGRKQKKAEEGSGFLGVVVWVGGLTGSIESMCTVSQDGIGWSCKV